MSLRLVNKSPKEKQVERRVLEVRVSLGVDGQWAKCTSGGQRTESEEGSGKWGAKRSKSKLWGQKLNEKELQA